MMGVVAVFRDESFSPNSVEADKAILTETTACIVQDMNTEVAFVLENELATWCNNNARMLNNSLLWLSMGRLPETTAFLDKRQDRGDIVINSGRGVMACSRSNIHHLMLENGLPVPLEYGSCGYWLKRGDQAAQTNLDVMYADSDAERDTIIRDFHRRGIADVLVQAHIEGDLIKFYGVAGTGFFRTFYPTADGQSKFDNEKRNGLPHYYEYDVRHLFECAEKISRLTEVPVYGGDCIVTPNGDFFIIDFNDWPSFSRCRDEAVVAISNLCKRKMADLMLHNS